MYTYICKQKKKKKWERWQNYIPNKEYSLIFKKKKKRKEERNLFPLTLVSFKLGVSV